MYCRTVQGQLCGNIWKPTPRRNTSVHVSPCPSSTGASSKPTGSWCLTPILLRFVERLKQVMWCPRGQFCWWLDNSNTSHKLCYLSCVETSFSRRWEAAKKRFPTMAHQTNQTNGICEFNIIQLAIMILAHTFSVVQMVLKASQTPWFRYVTRQVTSLTIPLFSRLHSSEFPDFAWALFADWDDWVIVQGLESLLSGLSGTFHDWNRVNEAT